MKQTGYYRFPTIAGDNIVFICEDDLWRVSVKGGIPVRLTSNLGEITRPHLSPDGKWLAFTGREEGNPEVYIMPAEGGSEKCLTFLGAGTNVVNWTHDSKNVIFTSNYGQPFVRINKGYKVSIEGGSPELLPVGYAHNISMGPKKGTVIGVHTADPARWKRYRGGTAGTIWIDSKDKGEFKKLINLKGNLGSPMWVGDRIYFISDHEGIGNLYSCTPDGKDLKSHTKNKEYFVRNASSDGKRIVYHSGGEIYVFDPKTDKSTKVEIDYRSPKIQLNRKFISSARFFEDFNLHPEGHSLSFNIRGKAFAMPNWDGTAIQLGEPDGVRYRLTQWFDEKNKFVTISDKGGKEALEIHSTEYDADVKRLDGLDIGRALDMEISPTEEKVVLSNHRSELILVDLAKKKAKVLDKSKYQHIHGFSWSPDGKWITYACADTTNTISIKLCEIKTGKIHRITDTRFKDVNPSFDPDGKFIYFLSYREFNPVYDSMYFDLGFPRGMRAMLVSLAKDTMSPFAPIPKFLKEEDKKEEEKSKDKKKDKRDEKTKVPDVKIDFEGIENRVVAFPMPEGRYNQIWGLKGKVLISSSPIRGSLNKNWYVSEPEMGSNLEYFDFEQQKTELVATNISYFKVSRKNEVLAYRSGNRLRVTGVLPIDKNKPADDKPGKRSGWVELDRMKVSIIPSQEWQQMFTEIWRLQKEHFWDPNMCGIDWDKVYKRYFALLGKVATRSEFSDLIWEMQGELGTSHAYELGGDYRPGPFYRQGVLGADFTYDEKTDAYKVKHIVKGDSWNEKEDSSLNRLGVNVKEGDVLLAVNNKKLSKTVSPHQLLINQANTEVILTFAGKKKSETKSVMVKALSNDSAARYREWVENNRRIVSEATNGRVGYIHVPNMGPEGYSEFHRYYFAEVEKESVIIDVRYNGGGHVSQLLLEKLARKRIAYNINRWGTPEPYPSDSILGSVIAITNECAGSDGDIFSHCYKIMKLGKLVGTRTWGGVIGIWPRHKLVDGSVTTQPEFSFWFVDVGWGVENYGTDPDVEVEYKPQDWVNGVDPQLQKSIDLIMHEMSAKPPKLPNFGKIPSLNLPE